MQNLSWQDRAVRDALRHIKQTKPFCYGLTNYIAANLSANVLLAVGAGPAIGAALDWQTAFGRHANALWINAACLMSNSPHEVRQAARAAHEAGVPWVLDPVAVGAGATEYDRVVQGLLDFKPTAIRGNASELIALAGGNGGGKGVETTLTSQDALPFIEAFSRSQSTVTAVSGPIDFITDGQRTLAVEGGDIRLTQVTGAGCSLGALTAAFLTTSIDTLTAVAAAHVLYAEASERASDARGTGSFAVKFLDELSLLNPDIA
ncbi:MULTISPECIES: hydroxyethylthiazole kinase [unclassified Pantoea]|uniref:hydroxyethylthiazole kinase n=1 Tax=unclassified Pantoea TaxID=2630326 RepID=UPI001CD81A79|nr:MULTISPECIES: hydroxyethylthiazole kinase [unclassified Pantoea]MCA1179712.1 hydroxyethylthiazole kinase [Pantoea sp. alder69]MCA1252307.1 hydroxyethylthiazole kinase [Pantoea sp. alder70]MCA1268055.1 hydroxyethylthiazole kinase [Pantoea sp. alder81]